MKSPAEQCAIVIARGRPVIHAVLPLADAAAAHRLMEQGPHVGKIVLAVSPDAGIGARAATMPAIPTDARVRSAFTGFSSTDRAPTDRA